MKQNGYFQLVNLPSGGYGIKFFPPKDEGEPIGVNEVVAWLDAQKLPYEMGSLKQFIQSGKEIVCRLGRDECPVINETYDIQISEDNMFAVVRFYPPSEGGARLSFNEFLSSLRYKNIISGIQLSEMQEHFQSDGLYCTNLLVAQGKAPKQGTDARIEYLFNTDLRIQPTMNEDGSVDYFNLNIINHCHKGDVLARIIPEVEGEYGMNIMGTRIKPRDVKKAYFKYGNNIVVTEDQMAIKSEVDGHVMLVDDKVFVSDVYEVENVDNSTGNIDFNGSVKVNGNVASNFEVRASGNVIIRGVVEGAHIYAGGNIIISKGMNGMAKGTLEAGGNIIARFIESAKVVAENGYVNSESILHSNVTAGDEVVVNGKKGLVTGGHVQASNRIEVKTLGAEMGASTVVEVGVNPKLKTEYIELQRTVNELKKAVNSAQPILSNFAEKRARGINFSPEQINYIKETIKNMEVNKKLLEKKNDDLLSLQQVFESQRRAVVEVTGEAYPGTTIVIGDVSMTLQSSYKYCRFIREAGEVKMAPL